MSENREEFNNNLEEYKEMIDSSKPELGMKWFKYLIYFQLFFSAAEYLFQAVCMIFNFQNRYTQELFNLNCFNRDLRPVGVILGILWLIPAAMTLYARFELAGFKKEAPKKFIILVAATQVLTCAGEIFVKLSELYIVDARNVIGAVLALVLSYALGGFVFIYPNIVYFKKRAHLFVN